MAYLAPEFIKENRLCWLRSPLFIVKNKGKESYYFTEAEFNKDRNKIKGDVVRAKGIGELNVDTARASMFNEENQRLDILNFSEDGMNLLYELMGSQVEPRTEFIIENIDFSTIRE